MNDSFFDKKFGGGTVAQWMRLIALPLTYLFIGWIIISVLVMIGLLPPGDHIILTVAAAVFVGIIMNDFNGK